MKILEIPERNSVGDCAMFERQNVNGVAVAVFLGYKHLVQFQNILVCPEDLQAHINLVDHAKRDGVIITAAVGYRPIKTQIDLRLIRMDQKLKANLSPEELEKYILTAPSESFKPEVGKPGFSKHQKAKATDWNVSPTKEELAKDPNFITPQYRWMVAHAHEHGFIRTIQSEIWHTEIIPGATQFTFVKQNDSSWKSLV